jgi:DNA-binding NarL/FixJ family response regulator
MTRADVALYGCTALIVDDHRIFAEVISSHLAAAAPLTAVHLATKLPEARALARATRPDLVIVDYKLADECGLDLIPDLLTLDLGADVIVVSASRDPGHIMEAFERGARAWVDKTASVDDLLDAMVAVRGGDMYLSSASVGPVIEFHLYAVRRDESARVFTDRCTERELDVLRHLMAGMTRSGVAAALGLSTNTVRTHVQSLLRTFGVHSTLALIAAARDAGVTAAEPPPLALVRLT